MELFFQCPVEQAGFWTAQWRVDDGLEACVDLDGCRHLRGGVRVSCPLCGQEHAFAPDELACPLSVAGSGPAKSLNNKGGA